jgi:hypothetical protein
MHTRIALGVCTLRLALVLFALSVLCRLGPFATLADLIAPLRLLGRRYLLRLVASQRQASPAGSTVDSC